MFGWFDQVAVSAGLAVSTPDDDARAAAGVTAGHRWSVTARRSVDSEGAADHSTVFVAAGAAVANVDEASLRAGVTPVTIRIGRDDRVKAHFGGDEVAGLIATVFAALWGTRKNAVTIPRARMSAPSESDRLVPLEVVDRIACWPGDACYGGDADVAPPSSQLARTPDGGLCVTVSVSPWTPLTMWTNTFGDAAHLRHALETWALLVESLTAKGVIVPRDPAGIHLPTNTEVAAIAAALGDRLAHIDR